MKIAILVVKEVFVRFGGKLRVMMVRLIDADADAATAEDAAPEDEAADAAGTAADTDDQRFSPHPLITLLSLYCYSSK